MSKKLFLTLLVIIIIGLYLLIFKVFYISKKIQISDYNHYQKSKMVKKEEFSSDLINLKEKVEKETQTKIIFVNNKGDFSEILSDEVARKVGYSEAGIKESAKNFAEGIFVARPVVFDKSVKYNKVFIFFDTDNYQAKNDDCIIAHEIGHIIIQNRLGILVPINDNNNEIIQAIDDSLTNWQADLFSINNHFNCQGSYDKIIEKKIDRFIHDDSFDKLLDKPYFIIDTDLRDIFLSQDVRERLINVYKEKYYHPEEISKALAIAEEIRKVKQNYNKEYHIKFVEKMIELHFPGKKLTDIAYIYNF
jgi:hypothetical protein